MNTDTPDRVFVTNPDMNTAQHIPLAPGTTVGQLFSQQMGNKNPSDYLIRVGVPGQARTPAPPDQVLNPGDAISFTPTKIQGA